MSIKYISTRNSQTDSNGINTRRSAKHRKPKRTIRTNHTDPLIDLREIMPATTSRSMTGMQVIW